MPLQNTALPFRMAPSPAGNQPPSSNGTWQRQPHPMRGDHLTRAL
jgi:hypothetical protein